MKYSFNDKEYDIVISYKNIKNMYMRIKGDLCIYISVPVGASNKKIMEFIKSNSSFIEKNLLNIENKKSKNFNKFMYLGKCYDICYSNTSSIVLGDSKVFMRRDYDVLKFYKKMAKEVFEQRYDICFSIFNKKVVKPDLRIRRMTSKWGVCNISKKIITLNLELIKLDIKYLDYVIIHELSHLIYPNHSKEFWSVVEKYCPCYKKYRKEMKNII